jgi:hypothetical protein
MTSHGDDSSSVQENPYLALREAKIKRNEARLRELGLVKKVNELPRPTVSSNASRKRGGSSNESSSSSSPLTLRRSRRLSDQPEQVNYKDISSDLDGILNKRLRVVTPSTDNDPGVATYSDNSHESKPPPKPRPPPALNSVRSISLCTQRLVLGGSHDAPVGLLGVPMEQTGKEFVVYKSFENASSNEDRHRLEGARLSFNKYCGVQEWQDCAFLWVNLGGKGNTVVNDFLDDGQQMTWFGGSRMYDGTPVIEKLIRWGREATDSSSKIILWCRRFEAERKGFGPYVCLGRLSYQSHEPGSHPLAFVWNLLDSHRLSHHAHVKVRETFQQFMGAS